MHTKIEMRPSGWYIMYTCIKCKKISSYHTDESFRISDNIETVFEYFFRVQKVDTGNVLKCRS